LWWTDQWDGKLWFGLVAEMAPACSEGAILATVEADEVDESSFPIIEVLVAAADAPPYALTVLGLPGRGACPGG
jgi:hypothetical protein